MKFLILITLLIFTGGCLSQASSLDETGKSIQPTPVIENSNSTANGQGIYVEYQYDKNLLDKLNAENERFKKVPDEFKSVDFENFKFDFGRLKNGELERNQTNNRIAGIFNFYLEDVYYIDLIDDLKKEAVVIISRVSCGGSCDGGAEQIYFYSSNNKQPQLINILKTGSNAYGCSLKSFTIKNKKIYVEQFGRCIDNTERNSEKEYICKFCVKDETHSVYSINKDGLKRESADIVETETKKVMNAPSFISINE